MEWRNFFFALIPINCNSVGAFPSQYVLLTIKKPYEFLICWHLSVTLFAFPIQCWFYTSLLSLILTFSVTFSIFFSVCVCFFFCSLLPPSMKPLAHNHVTMSIVGLFKRNVHHSYLANWMGLYCYPLNEILVNISGSCVCVCVWQKTYHFYRTEKFICDSSLTLYDLFTMFISVFCALVCSFLPHPNGIEFCCS